MKNKRRITVSELTEIGDNWLNRTRRLASVWQDESLPMIRRDRAFVLWQTMSRRVTRCFNALSEFNQKRNARIAAKFPPGGIFTE